MKTLPCFRGDVNRAVVDQTAELLADEYIIDKYFYVSAAPLYLQIRVNQLFLLEDEPALQNSSAFCILALFPAVGRGRDDIDHLPLPMQRVAGTKAVPPVAPVLAPEQFLGFFPDDIRTAAEWADQSNERQESLSRRDDPRA